MFSTLLVFAAGTVCGWFIPQPQWFTDFIARFKD